MDTFGERLRVSLTIAGMSATGLAKCCKVSRQTVRHWTRMQRAELTGEHLAHVALALGVSLRWLAIGTGDPTPPYLAETRKAYLPENG